MAGWVPLTDEGGYDNAVRRDDDYDITFPFVDADGPLNLVGWTFAAQIRDAPNRPTELGELLAQFEVDVSEAAAGIVALRLSRAVTAAIPRDKGVWDLQVTDPSDKSETWLEGPVEIKGDVSRS